jgi:hypothetical protein
VRAWKNKNKEREDDGREEDISSESKAVLREKDISSEETGSF